MNYDDLEVFKSHWTLMMTQMTKRMEGSLSPGLGYSKSPIAGRLRSMEAHVSETIDGVSL